MTPVTLRILVNDAAFGTKLSSVQYFDPGGPGTKANFTGIALQSEDVHARLHCRVPENYRRRNL